MHEILEAKNPREIARQEILAIRDEVAAMGGNDYEIPAFNILIENLSTGKCTPEKALREAHNIRENKQQDH